MAESTFGGSGVTRVGELDGAPMAELTDAGEGGAETVQMVPALTRVTKQRLGFQRMETRCLRNSL
ncbi:hypothetical protein SESBI_20841 [Sesbania bispinosa]|nr:hypothetical protein SESBI_20841 [Sesbania bispinosa]